MLNQSATSTNPARDAGGTAIAAMATSIREFLPFKLGDEEYGIDILLVQASAATTFWQSARWKTAC